jgi:hypothetical protein
MEESKEKAFSRLAQAVMGEAHTPETIKALAIHAAELATLRRTAASDVISIGTRISECAYLIKDAVVAVAGDTQEARKEAADKFFAFIEQSVQIRRAVARQYMRIAERFKDTGLDPSSMTVRDLLSGL